ncbi:hypothetical protein CDAR_119041 [Caerostris darwini]|uniref:Uncharacterized protein n=1 Tax=Caerostris darwini TaxID=1538125 RepID=A0AAV4VB79_9ARAC|nr:hypothetical protein CDAR_119041 [Caerostris darwini]
MFDCTRTLSLPESNCFPCSHGHYTVALFSSNCVLRKLEFHDLKWNKGEGGDFVPVPSSDQTKVFVPPHFCAIDSLLCRRQSSQLQRGRRVGEKRYMERLR